MTPPTEPPPYFIYLLILAIGGLVTTIVYLFKHYNAKLAAREAQDLATERVHAAEREKWAAERTAFGNHHEKIRADYEEKHRQVVERHVGIINEMFAASRGREDGMRGEFLENADKARREIAQSMEAIASKAADAQDRISLVLDKFYDRLLGPRRPKG